MEKNIPVYRVEISEDTESDLEVDYIALVDRPAVKIDFLKFNEDTRPLAFKIANEDRRIVSGIAMLADTPIYRYDDKTKREYYTVFDKDTIYKIVQKFFKKSYQKNVNLMHSEDMQVHDVVVFESFIVDRSRGILPMAGFEDAPEGSWFVSMFVENDTTWKLVKENKLRGFSVEGLFTFVKTKARAEDYGDQVKLDKIKELLQQYNAIQLA